MVKLRQEIEQQRKVAQQQMQVLDELMKRLDELEKSGDNEDVAAVKDDKPAAVPPTPQAKPTPESNRDPVGDLNATQSAEGKVPVVSARSGNSSITIGGFIKTIGYYDSNAEDFGPIFFASQLGTRRDDQNGGTSISAGLSRVSLDAKTKVGSSELRGYLEFDLSTNSLNWRLGYLSIEDKWGSVLAGKYWSNFMDLRTLPEGLSEPTLSGAIFSRQAQVRYTRKFSNGITWSASAEDPDSNDVLAPGPVQTRTSMPDLTSALRYDNKKAGVQVAGLFRRITIDPDGESDFSTNGWGVQSSAYLMVGEKDKVAVGFLYGKGLGRYLLGLDPTSGAFVNPDTERIVTRPAYGTFAHYKHQWNKPCRTTVGGGYAAVSTIDVQPDESLRASFYGISNLLCTVNTYITIGGEYSYGRRWNRVGSIDNNRFTFGIQVF